MASPARVLMVTGSYPPMRCGVGDYTGRLARALSEQPDFTLQVLTTQLAEPRSDDPVWVRRLMPSWRIEALPRFLAAAREFKPDIVHLQYPTQGYRVASGPVLIPLLARLRLGAAVVETWHEFPPADFCKETVARWGLAAMAQAVIYVRPDYPRHVSGVLARATGRTPLHFVPNASVIPALRMSPAERVALRQELACGDREIVSFFGFAYPNKGIESLFEIADPARHHLLIIGELLESDAYHRRLRRLADSERWRGNVTITGFVPPERAARLLAVSEAAVFPFTEGGGVWNSSLHAATLQGTFAVVTSRERHGYAPDQNVYYAPPGAIEDMRAALARYAGTRGTGEPGATDDWGGIARAHARIYHSLL